MVSDHLPNCPYKLFKILLFTIIQAIVSLTIAKSWLLFSLLLLIMGGFGHKATANYWGLWARSHCYLLGALGTKPLLFIGGFGHKATANYWGF